MFPEEAVELGAVLKEHAVGVVFLWVAIRCGGRTEGGFRGGFSGRMVFFVDAVAGDGAAGKEVVSQGMKHYSYGTCLTI